MFFDKKYSNYNEEILKIKKPIEKDFDVEKKDVEAIYKQRNADYRQIQVKEKYSSAGMGKILSIYFSIPVFGASIGCFINHVMAGAIIFLILGVVLIIVGYVLGDKYKNQVSAKENSYKRMSIYTNKMADFVLANDLYNDKVFEIKKPYLKNMEAEIKKYDYLKLKYTMVECYRRMGLKVYSTGVKKFGGVILRACDETDFNIAVVIFPYDNPISGYTVQNLGESINKINHKIDSVHIISRFGEYLYSRSISLFLLKPFKIIDAFDIASYIWDANTTYYSCNQKEDKCKEEQIIKNEQNQDITQSNNKSNFIKWNNIKSKSVKESYYNIDNKVLYLKFTYGEIYAYFDVDKNIYTEFLTSSSKGRFVYYHLCKYRYKRIKESEVE